MVCFAEIRFFKWSQHESSSSFQKLIRTKVISVLLKNLFSALSLEQRFHVYDDLRVIFSSLANVTKLMATLTSKIFVKFNGHSV